MFLHGAVIRKAADLPFFTLVLKQCEVKFKRAALNSSRQLGSRTLRELTSDISLKNIKSVHTDSRSRTFSNTDKSVLVVCAFDFTNVYTAKSI